MRVTLDRQEKQAGLVFKKTNYTLTATIEFSEEEKAIIRKHNFGEYLLIEHLMDTKHNDPVPFFVRDFVKSRTKTFLFMDLLLAQRFEAELKENLRTLKSMIESGVVTTGKETFTL